MRRSLCPQLGWLGLSEAKPQGVMIDRWRRPPGAASAVTILPSLTVGAENRKKDLHKMPPPSMMT